jgi:hypothetical protein
MRARSCRPGAVVMAGRPCGVPPGRCGAVAPRTSYPGFYSAHCTPASPPKSAPAPLGSGGKGVPQHSPAGSHEVGLGKLFANGFSRKHS